MATKVKLIADNAITTTQIDTSSLDSHFSGGTGVTYSSGEISIGQAVHSTDSPTFADLTLTGNLNITGDLNSYNVTDLDVTDQTITLGAGQTEELSGGSGIIVDGSGASILWDETNDTFDINKGLNVDSDTFVVDNTNNRVGIGTNNPQKELHIDAASPNILLSGTSFPALKFSGSDNVIDAEIYYGVSANDLQFKNYNNGIISFTTNNNQGIVIDASGNVRLGTTGNGSTVEIGDISGANYRLTTGGYSLTFQKYDADATAFVNALTLVGTGVNDGAPNVKVENKLSVNSDIDANAILKVSRDSGGEIARFVTNGNSDFNFIANPPEFNLEDSGGTSGEKRGRITVNGGILRIQGISDDDSTVNHNLILGYLDTGNVAIGYPTTQNYPSDAKFMVSNDGANGMEFSGTAISGENRILNYNRSGSTHVPMTIQASEFNVAIGGGTEYFRVLSDGRINLPGNTSLGTSGTPVLANVASYGLQIATHQFGIAPNGGADGVKFEIDSNGNINMDHTGYLRIPRGTTAQRPGSPTTGMIRYNTTLGVIEEFDGSNWKNLSQTFSASGGTITTSGIYTYHTFTSSGTFTVTSGAKSISYLIVAGGGGGGFNAGAGGGAGGMITGTTTVDSGTGSYTITIGGGGAGKTVDTGTGDNGSNTSAFGITASGGGGGASSNRQGANGGSGGGSAYSFTGGSGTSGQGNDGGDGDGQDGASRAGAGGGGKGSAGQDTQAANDPGDGGAGSQWLDGNYYAGGGGGAAHAAVSGGSGGTGGGGAGGSGGNPGTTAGSNGTTNTGGGGGAGGGYGSSGGNGGSGIVIIRYS